MQSIALSTVLILVLLLPGFFFVVGLYAPERFARDAAPQNPLAAFASTVCFAFLSHSLLTFLLSLSGETVPWRTVLNLLQTAPGPPQGELASANLGSLIEERPGSVFGYVIGSWTAGFALGVAMAKALMRLGLQGFVIRHPWVHSFRAGSTGTVAFAHVLSDVSHDGRVLLYRGLLHYFGLKADGTFAYLVLSATEQRFLHLDGTTPITGRLRPIGKYSNTDAAPAASHPPRTADQEFLRFVLVLGTGVSLAGIAFIPLRALIALLVVIGALWWIALRPVVEEHRLGAVMVISGERISDVVFQGHAVADLERTRSRTPDIIKTLGAPERTLSDVERHRTELLELWGGELPSRNADDLTLREIQQMLRELGYDPGSVDGKNGPLSIAAVKEFQVDSGFSADGVLGPETRLQLLLEHEALKSITASRDRLS